MHVLLHNCIQQYMCMYVHHFLFHDTVCTLQLQGTNQECLRLVLLPCKGSMVQVFWQSCHANSPIAHVLVKDTCTHLKKHWKCIYRYVQWKLGRTVTCGTVEAHWCIIHERKHFQAILCNINGKDLGHFNLTVFINWMAELLSWQSQSAEKINPLVKTSWIVYHLCCMSCSNIFLPLAICEPVRMAIYEEAAVVQRWQTYTVTIFDRFHCITLFHDIVHTADILKSYSLANMNSKISYCNSCHE